MPLFDVTSPDGTMYEVEAPEGATQEDLISYVQQNLPDQGAPKPEEAPKPEPEESTFVQDIGEVAKAVPRGFVQTFGSAIEGIGALGTVAGGAVDTALGVDMFDPLEENELVKAGRAMNKALDESFLGADPRFVGNMANQMGAGFGSLATFFIPGLGQMGLVAKGAGLAKVATGAAKAAESGGVISRLGRGLAIDKALLQSGTAMGRTAGVVGLSRYPLAVGVGAGEQSRRLQAARDAGIEVEPGTEAASIIIGGVIGLTELYTPDRALHNLLRIAEKGAGIGIMKRVGRALATGGIEAVQEMMAGIAQDITEQQLYNKDKKIGDSALDEFAVGGVVGGLMQLALDIAIPGRTKPTAVPDGVKDRPPADVADAPAKYVGEARQLEAAERHDAGPYGEYQSTRRRTLADTTKALDVREEANDAVAEAQEYRAHQIPIDAANEALDGKTPAQAETIGIATAAMETINATVIEMEELSGPVHQALAAKLIQMGQNPQDSYTLGELGKLGVPDGELRALAEERNPETEGPHSTKADIIALAKSKNIITTSKNFREFARRVTGTANFKDMGIARLDLLYGAVDRIPESGTSIHMPLADPPVHTFEQLVKAGNKAIADRKINVTGVKEATGLTENKDAQKVLDEMVANQTIEAPTKKAWNANYTTLAPERFDPGQAPLVLPLRGRMPDMPVSAEEPNRRWEGEERREYIVRSIGNNHAVVAAGYGKTGPDNNEQLVGQDVVAVYGTAEEAQNAAEIMSGVDLYSSFQFIDPPSGMEKTFMGPTSVSLRSAADRSNTENRAELNRRAQVAAASPMTETGKGRLDDFTRVAEAQMEERGNTMPLQFVQDIRDYLDQTTVGAIPPGEIGPEGVVTGDRDAIARTLLIAMDSIEFVEPGGEPMTDVAAAERVAQVIDHETLHYLVQSGVISQDAWDSLFKFVQKTVRKSNSDGLTYMQEATHMYEDLAVVEATRQGLAGAERDAFIQAYFAEEAMAESFRDWAADKRLVTGKPASIFKQIGNFFKRLAKSLNLAGIHSVEDIFGQIASGELARQSGGNRGSTEAARLAMAYHGGPTRWQPENGFFNGRPDLAYLGTGEGAHAYGWGFYSAQAGGVGANYINAGNRAPERNATIDGRPFQEFLNEVNEYAKVVPGHGRLVSQAIGQLWYEINNGNFRSGQENEIIDSAKENTTDPSHPLSRKEGIQEILESFRGRLEYAGTPGVFYKLDIPDAAIAKFMDYDAPLAEQPQSVQDALAPVIAKLQEIPAIGFGGAVPGQSYFRQFHYAPYDNLGDLTGKDIQSLLTQIASYSPEDRPDTRGLGATAMSLIRSRASGDLGATLKEFGYQQPVESLDEPWPHHFVPKRAVSKFLNSLGIPGIQYKDADSRHGSNTAVLINGIDIKDMHGDEQSAAEQVTHFAEAYSWQSNMNANKAVDMAVRDLRQKVDEFSDPITNIDPTTYIKDKEKRALAILEDWASDPGSVEFIDSTTRNYVIWDQPTLDQIQVLERDEKALMQPLPLGPPLRVERDDRGRVKLWNVATAMNDNHLEVYGRPLVPTNTEDYRMILHNLTAAYDEQMERQDTPEEWYVEDIAEALQVTENILPEVADPLHRDTFLTMAALLSPQQEVTINWHNAVQAFAGWINDGVMPLMKPNGTNWGVSAHRTGLQLFQKLIEDNGGVAGAIGWLRDPRSAREIAEYRRDSGLFVPDRPIGKYLPGEMGINDITIGAYMMGPKVGDFMMNATGYDQTAVTVDLWIARQYNRLIGRLLDVNNTLRSKGMPQNSPRNAAERQHIKNLITDLAEIKGVQPSAVQAVLWYYEQRLFNEHGIRAEPASFADAAYKTAEKLGKPVARPSEIDQRTEQDADGPIQGARLSRGKIVPQKIYQVTVRRVAKPSITREIFAESEADARGKALRSPQVMRDAFEIQHIKEKMPVGGIAPRMSRRNLLGMSPYERMDLIKTTSLMRLFAGNNLDAVLNELPGEKSRRTLVFMTPEDFIKMAASGLRNPGQEKVIAENMDRGMLLSSLPNLTIRGGLDGKEAKVIGHEGRHRSHAFIKNDYALMPVTITHEMYRWGEDASNNNMGNKLPIRLEQENGKEQIVMPDSLFYPQGNSMALLADVAEDDYIQSLIHTHAGLALDPDKLEQRAKNLQAEEPNVALRTVPFEGQKPRLTEQASRDLTASITNAANAGGAVRVHSSAALGMYGGTPEIAVTFDAMFPEADGMEGINATTAEVMMTSKEHGQQDAYVAMRVPENYTGENVRPGISIFFLPQAEGAGGRTEMKAENLQAVIDQIQTDNVQGFTAFQSDTARNINEGYEGIRFIWMPEYAGVTAADMENNLLAVVEDFDTIAQTADKLGIGSVQTSKYIAALGSEGTYDEIASQLIDPDIDGGAVGPLGESGPWRRSVRGSLEERDQRRRDQPGQGPGGGDVIDAGDTPYRLAIRDSVRRMSSTEMNLAFQKRTKFGATSHGTFYQNNTRSLPIYLFQGVDQDGHGFGYNHFLKHINENEFSSEAEMNAMLDAVTDAMTAKSKKITIKLNEEETEKKPDIGPFYNVYYKPDTGPTIQLGLEVVEPSNVFWAEREAYASIGNFYPRTQQGIPKEDQERIERAGPQKKAPKAKRKYKSPLQLEREGNAARVEFETRQRATKEDAPGIRRPPVVGLRPRYGAKKPSTLSLKASLGKYRSTGNRVRHYTPGEGLAAEHGAISDNAERILAAGIQKKGRVARGINSILRTPKVVNWRIKLQDKMLPVEHIIEMINDAGGEISDATNAYIAEQLYHGKTVEEVRQRIVDLYNPLMDEIKKSKTVTFIELEDYLVALHAKERNDFINEKRAEGGAPPTDMGAGITTADADIILQDFQAQGKTAELARLGGMARAIIQNTNDTRLRGGLVSQEIIDRSPYVNYVPLKGNATEDFEDNPDHPLYGREDKDKQFIRKGAGGIRGREDRTATGRRTPSVNILASILIQNQEAVIRSERNAVIKSFGDMVRANADLVLTDATGQKWDMSEYAEILETAPMEITVSDGGVIKLMPDKNYANADDVISFKEINPETGALERVNVRVNSVPLATAMKGAVTPEALGTLVRSLGAINRWLASVNTAWNPEFIISNLMKDTATGSIVAAQYDIPGLSREILMPGNLAKSLRAIESVLREGKVLRFRGQADSAYVAAFREMQKAGGTTEFLGIQDMDSILSGIQDRVGDFGEPGVMQSLRRGKKAAAKLADFIGDYNKVAENAVRLQLYKSLRDRGVSATQAAFAAKNLTVNFNKGGTNKVLANSFYLFYNASIQGSWVLINSLRSKRVQKIVAGIVVAGMMNDLLNSMLSGDDDNDGRSDWDEEDEFEKQMNLIFMNPFGGPPLKVPMPYGFNAFFNLGRVASSVTRPGGLKTWDAATSIGMTFLNSFNPIGGTNSLANFISPTLLDPVMDLYGNKDFANRSIAPPRMSGPGRANEPASQVYYNNTNPLAIKAAEFINKITGGNVVRPGKVDFSPNQYEYVFEYALGGLGAFVSRSTFKTPGNIYKALEGDWANVEMNDIVFLRKMVGSIGNAEDRRQYYDNAEDVALAKAEFDFFAKTGDGERVRDVLRRHGSRLQLSGFFKSVATQLTNHRKRLKEVRGNQYIKESAREKIEEQIKDQMNRLIDQANRLYNTRVRPRPGPQSGLLHID